LTKFQAYTRPHKYWSNQTFWSLTPTHPISYTHFSPTKQSHYQFLELVKDSKPQKQNSIKPLPFTPFQYKDSYFQKNQKQHTQFSNPPSLGKMQDTLQQQTKESSELPPKMSFSGHKVGDLSDGQHKGGYLAVVPRSRPACTCANRPGSVRCARHGYIVPGEKKKRVASKEILRRALTPPKRLGLRWLNFRPTPSRLSNMSMA